MRNFQCRVQSDPENTYSYYQFLFLQNNPDLGEPDVTSCLSTITYLLFPRYINKVPFLDHLLSSANTTYKITLKEEKKTVSFLRAS